MTILVSFRAFGEAPGEHTPGRVIYRRVNKTSITSRGESKTKIFGSPRVIYNIELFALEQGRRKISVAAVGKNNDYIFARVFGAFRNLGCSP